MSKRNSYIRVRLYEKEKDDWEDYAKNNQFPSVSQFVRFVVNDAIEKGYNRSSQVSVRDNNLSKNEVLQTYKELYSKQETQLKEYREMVYELMKEMRLRKDIKLEDSIKGKILKWLEMLPNKLGSEEIADLIGGDEIDALKILNKMEIDLKLIKSDKNLKYKVVQNGNNI